MTNILRDHMKVLLGESERPAKPHDWRKGRDLCPNLRCSSDWGKGWEWCQRCGHGRPR